MDLSFILNAIFVGAALIVGVSSTLIFKMKKDNPIEQIAEETIKEKTGVDIDLTPE